MVFFGHHQFEPTKEKIIHNMNQETRGPLELAHLRRANEISFFIPQQSKLSVDIGTLIIILAQKAFTFGQGFGGTQQKATKIACEF